MEDDEIIIVNKKTSKDSKNNKKSKAVKNTASKNKAKKDKDEKKAEEKAIKSANEKEKKFPIIIILFLILIVVILILSSDLFNIKNIEVIGNSILSSEKIISVSQIEKENNIFRTNKKSVKEKLKEEAYVEKVKIHFKLPNTVQIEIVERLPKFMLQFADSFVYINNQGYMLQISNEPLSLPVIVGFVTDLSNIREGNRLDLEDLKKMEKIIKVFEVAKANDIANLITKIDISDENNYTLLLEGEGKKAYLGNCTELNTRMLLLKKIVELEKGKNGEVFLNVDLNNDDVYFRESVNV